mgnify:CR=1 FL=1
MAGPAQGGFNTTKYLAKVLQVPVALLLLCHPEDGFVANRLRCTEMLSPSLEQDFTPNRQRKGVILKFQVFQFGRQVDCST